MGNFRYYLSIFMVINFIVLTGCQFGESTDQDGQTSTPTQEEPQTEEDTTNDSPEKTDTSEYKPAEWTKTPITTSDNKLTTIEGENFQVDVYQIAIEKASKNGLWADPETNEPLLKEGDDLVFLNYVVTNTSDKPLQMGASLVSIAARYSDWKYLQGMDSIVDRSLQDQLQLHSTPITSGKQAPYVLQPGTSYAISDNFKYQQGSELELKASFTPVDDQGNLQHDLRKEARAQTTIQ